MTTVSTLLELPEDLYNQMRTYLLTHPGIDLDKFVAEAINDALLTRSQAELPQQPRILPDAAPKNMIAKTAECPWIFTPNFLSQREADNWFNLSQILVEWRHNSIRMFGKKILLPRLEAIVGVGDYSYSGLTLQAQPWSEEFLELKEKVEKESSYTYQIAIGNQYRDGKDYIGWHSDDSPEMGRDPAIASLSLGATRKFQLRHKKTKEIHTFELTHGSLFVMLPGCQERYQHRICKSANDEPRINWTFRPLIATAQSRNKATKIRRFTPNQA